ncbi:KpsF/GutQ family sugar-phosphate isomerase [Lichenihabitans sp. Uapishka_5]|uniref:KpsF/GutQ family sugar-phosphate isomerase n=1 Tax=Lichenihabitans sp. Uapishka_5 TaxID=3037302 RepID=UPI0029E82303|nr:KpsF/GutQ family sugar-phosphate isomerase [Lichenihabitans sp. Uapishka_5]MDX7950640.1 KpsF/GutQ family sugar-phosphate isomerase [Lichenihabitans sp. Uapishka_5]
MVEASAWAEPAATGSPKAQTEAAVISALRALEVEQRGLSTLRDAVAGDLGRALAAVVEIILKARGRVVVTGIGKSGHVARKIAATFASTGTASMFIHPAEASHGDLGMVTRDDVVLALSWSGETVELRDIIHYAGRYGIPLIAMTAAPASALARAAGASMILPKVDEACPHNLAPTTSTLMQLALGDALAVALLERRGFTASHFQQFHPGGKLGAALLKVAAVMRADDLPVVTPAAGMKDVLVAMSAGRLGCALVVHDGRLEGIITDGDLRRYIDDDLLQRRPREIMTAALRHVGPDVLASAALDLMNAGPRPVSVMPVLHHDRVVGILHLHHLVAAGLS